MGSIGGLDGWQRPLGDDPSRIDLGMRGEIMNLDVIEVGRFSKRGVVLPMIKFFEPTMDVGITVPDGSKVTLEVRDVDDIEPDDGRIQPDIGLGQSITDQEPMTAQDRLYPI